MYTSCFVSPSNKSKSLFLSRDFLTRWKIRDLIGQCKTCRLARNLILPNMERTCPKYGSRFPKYGRVVPNKGHAVPNTGELCPPEINHARSAARGPVRGKFRLLHLLSTKRPIQWQIENRLLTALSLAPFAPCTLLISGTVSVSRVWSELCVL